MIHSKVASKKMDTSKNRQFYDLFPFNPRKYLILLKEVLGGVGRI